MTLRRRLTRAQVLPFFEKLAPVTRRSLASSRPRGWRGSGRSSSAWLGPTSRHWRASFSPGLRKSMGACARGSRRSTGAFATGTPRMRSRGA